MPWVKLDDQFSDHPKVLEAGPLASWLYVCGLTYAAKHLTDGFIPSGKIRALADVDNPQALADKLVATGLWDRVDNGYIIHDYLEYNPTSEETKRKRAANAKRQAEYRGKQGRYETKSNGVSNGTTNNATDTSVTSAPSPYPSPTPLPNKEKKGRKKAAADSPNNLLVALFQEKAWEARPTNWRAESAAAKKLLKEYTAEDALACYHWLKADKFWQDKHLGIASIHKQMGPFKGKGKSKSGKPAERVRDYSGSF